VSDSCCSHRWRPFASFDELLGRQGTHQVVKTVLFEVPGDRLVLVALRAEDDLDYGKLAGTLGVDRDPITLAATGRIADLLGVEGRVAPALRFTSAFRDRCLGGFGCG
jgi:prolyl-tRNA editing enzyme YbaK/EbsC (Cys-tRNA(Pro) deacylase)